MAKENKNVAKNSKDLFASLATKFAFSSNKGNSTENLYKKSALANYKSEKHGRLTIRKQIEKCAKQSTTIFASNNKDLIADFCKDFDIWYKETFILNDYSLQSVCSAQRKDTALIETLLNNVSKVINKK